MQYNALKLVVASRKVAVPLSTPSGSFFIKAGRIDPYIEPSFSKVEFPKEKPAILLVSAVGASGKTATAHALSYDTRLPILDLSKHKPVADNTLTGILTNSYPIEMVGTVLGGLRSGTHGIIIDGIDEGRSKTTEEGFEAFLDDLIERSQGAPNTVIVVFGRGQVLLSTWFYLAEKNADVGMIQIDPFNLEKAKQYIDAHAQPKNSGQQQNYEKARDNLLEKLGAAFSPVAVVPENSFLSFIGYPPVLEAISTLLQQEQNYHRIQQALDEPTGGELEIDLLIRISDYLLDRDHDEKALPNFIESIAAEVGGTLGQALRSKLFDRDEQCARVLARALKRQFTRQVVEDAAINERYEKAVATWCPDHPFLDDTKLRSAVFAAIAVARCALSGIQEYRILAYDYATTNRPTYHLLYFMSELSKGREIGVQFLNTLIQSSSEFLGMNAEISIDIDGESWEEPEETQDNKIELTIDVEFPDRSQQRTFVFNGILEVDSILLGPYIVNTRATLPCNVKLSGNPALEAIGDCNISAQSIQVDTPELVLRTITKQNQKDTHAVTGLFVNAHKAEGHVNTVSLGGGKVDIQCVTHTLDYPLARYVQKVEATFSDPTLQEKHRRVRSILSQFRSHKRGTLAKYRDKIEHERVLRNELGKKVLAALLTEGILRMDTKFYYVNPDQCDAKLGISWHQLRQYKSSKQLESFLRSIH